MIFTPPPIESAPGAEAAAGQLSGEALVAGGALGEEDGGMLEVDSEGAPRDGSASLWEDFADPLRTLGVPAARDRLLQAHGGRWCKEEDQDQNPFKGGHEA